MEFVKLCAFVFGVTYLVRHTLGPGNVFLRFRIWAGLRHEFWLISPYPPYTETTVAGNKSTIK
jgi:hypothetical protein